MNAALDTVADAPTDPAARTESTELTRRQRRTLLLFSVIGLAAPAIVSPIVLLINGASPITMRQFWFFAHLGAGVVIVHGFAGGLTTLLSRQRSRLREAVRLTTTASLAVVSWVTVITGTWMVYPPYREIPPKGANHVEYPMVYMLENDLWLWHVFAMEWKEFMGWVTPILATAVAFVAYRYGDLVKRDQRVRAVAVAFFAIAFLSALLAAGLGAGINAVAPNDFLRK